MLSSKQEEFLQSCSHRWNVKTGATRSGKTFMDLLYVIPQRILKCRGEGLIVLMGNTLGTLNRNILDPMREMWGASLVGTVQSGSAGNTVRLFGKKCYVLGADNKRHVARIQGAAIEYCYGDEITTWAQEVFDMLKSRLSCPNSHFDGTCNPDNPRHWFKQFLDSDADVYVQPYTIDDNPFLEPAFVAALKQEYTGTVYYNRFILGQWAAAEGLIYRSFADAAASGDGRFLWKSEEKPRLQKLAIGVDFGGNGSFHSFVAVGVLHRRGGVVALCSRRVDPKGDADQLAEQFMDFARTVFSSWGEIHAVYCDSAEQVLIRHLRYYARRTDFSWLADRIYNAKKIEIIDRIRLTSILMGGGRFWYLPTAATLRDALATALWSGKTPGEDERLDDGTTDIDTLDAFEYAIERDRDELLRMTT